jgi:hypothetical protein
MGDHTHLEEALRLFDAAGFTFQSARTLRLLGQTVAARDPDLAIKRFHRSLGMHQSMAAAYEHGLTQNALKEVLKGRACSYLSARHTL